MIRSKTRHAFSFAALLLISTASAFLQQLPPTVPFTLGETNVGSCGHSQWLLNGGSRLHPLPSQQRQIGGMRLRSSTKVTMSTSDENNDAYFDGKTTAVLVGGQSLLILASIAIAALVGTPKLGLGPGFDLNWQSFSTGVLYTLPLGLLAAALDIVEDKFPALQDVTKATQRSVLALLGGKFKPSIAFVTSLALGCVAGVGEEMLFRGVLQYELTSRVGQGVAIGVSSLIFGALHAVTPLYAILAGLASVYFGVLYIWSSNLAVPITAHAVYDLIALLFAHWTVSRLNADEQTELSQWVGPGDKIVDQ